MLAVKGTIHDNAIVPEDKDIMKYEGRDVIITILDFPYQKKKKKIDFDQFVVPTERASRADEYVRELRDNDRI